MLRERRMKKFTQPCPNWEVEESSPVVHVDEIVAKNNITNLCTLKILHDIAISKNMQMDSFAPKV
jgi:hypothetical protein